MKVGYVAIVGKPNTGKSTLLNRLLNFKLAAVSPKPQTTRKRVLGILNGEDYQIIFLDTPGILKPKHKLHERMVKTIDESIYDADIVLVMVDVEQQQIEEKLLSELKTIDKPCLLAINKIDTIKKDLLLPMIEEYSHLFSFKEIIPISALRGDGVEDLLSAIISYLPEGTPFFSEDILTTDLERDIVAEIIREKLFLFYGEEIPYATAVEIEEFAEEQERKKVYIRAVIFVDKDSQKGILIGKGGRALKRVGKTAREEIEMLIGRPVFLDLWVKVRRGWRNDERMLRELGY